MGRFGAALALVVIGVVSAFAAEITTRKAGLWEMKTTTSEGNSVSMQQCTDAQTDQAMQAGVGSASQRDCSKRDVQKSGATTTIDSVCTTAGKPRTFHAVITGSFDSGYTMTITTQGEGQPAARTTTIAAKWLGPCAADQKPGDVIMPNGMKMNIQNMQKGMGQPGAPGAPPTH
jgi:septal ring-binding cell division protein DamX